MTEEHGVIQLQNSGPVGGPGAQDELCIIPQEETETKRPHFILPLSKQARRTYKLHEIKKCCQLQDCHQGQVQHRGKTSTERSLASQYQNISVFVSLFCACDHLTVTTTALKSSTELLFTNSFVFPEGLKLRVPGNMTADKQLDRLEQVQPGWWQ